MLCGQEGAGYGGHEGRIFFNGMCAQVTGEVVLDVDGGIRTVDVGSELASMPARFDSVQKDFKEKRY